MKLFFTLCLSGFLPYISIGQETYSRIYDVEESLQQNLVLDMGDYVVTRGTMEYKFFSPEKYKSLPADQLFKNTWEEKIQIGIDDIDEMIALSTDLTKNDFINTAKGKFINELKWKSITNGRPGFENCSFMIEEVIEARNGDFIACGHISENTTGELHAELKYRKEDGIIVRFDSQGGLVWYRRFVHLVREKSDINGSTYIRSKLRNIKELENGDIAAAGNYLNRDISGRNEFGREPYLMWVLKVNENGCLIQYPCDNLIILE